MNDAGISAAPLLGAWDELVRNGAECVYDPELHDGPVDAVELPADRAAREAVAREVCASCPVLAECAAYVRMIRPESGVWAGRTAAEITDDIAVIEGVA
jgi:hypothetical protein